MKLNNRGKIAISEIAILVFGIVAFSWMVGMSLPVVSGQGRSSFDVGSGGPGMNFISSTNSPTQNQGSVGGVGTSDTLRLAPVTGTQTVKIDGVDYPLTQTGTREGVTYGVTDGGKFVEIKDGVPSFKNSLPDGVTIGTTTPTDPGSTLSKVFLPKEWYGTFADSLLSGLQWAGVAYGAGQLIGKVFGMSEAQTDSLSLAMATGFGVGRFLAVGGQQGGFISNIFGLQGGIPWWGSAGAGLGAGLLVFYLTYKEESKQTITFTCYPWDAPSGGRDCNKCNQQGILPCSEYQCRALGQSCQLLNPGTGEESCEWVNRHDVEPPVIEPWNEALTEGHTYSPDNTISPPDIGVFIKRTDSTTGCIKAFTPLSFGIKTTDKKGVPEPAKCKIDYIRKDNYDGMDFYFGGSPLFRTEHTQVMSLPGPSAFRTEEIIIEEGGEYSLHVRCQDANGNSNVASFVFKFCVEAGPDVTPPMIVTTNLLNNMPVAFDTESIDLEVYVNEPADCRWSRLDQDYDKMEEQMTCARSVMEMNAQMLYKCSTTLTGIKNRQANDYYFRCKDQPIATEGRNKMVQSYRFTIVGTEQLILVSASPDNVTIKDSTEVIKVTLKARTSAGYKNGEAFCYFSSTGKDDDYIQFLNTGGYDHSQDLWLPGGDYKYYIKCIDLGGNSDSKIINFVVDSDSNPPIVIRAYHQETYLKIVTNEKSSCVYNTVDCSYSFDDASKMTSVEGIEHFVDWNVKTSFYIKCEDEFGNRPAMNECSFVARPFEVPSI